MGPANFAVDESAVLDSAFVRGIAIWARKGKKRGQVHLFAVGLVKLDLSPFPSPGDVSES